MPIQSALRALVLATLALPAFAEDGPPPGTYRLDPTHARLVVDVDHLGFSRYLLFFRTMEATLTFAPDAPETMRVQATIDTTSVETLFPDPAYDFNADLRAEGFLNAVAHPKATFTSTAVTLTDENSAEVAGDFTLRGVTKPLTLTVHFNGGYGRQSFDPGGAHRLLGDGRVQPLGLRHDLRHPRPRHDTWRGRRGQAADRGRVHQP